MDEANHTEETELRREVELDCEPERAWRALTDEGELGRWLGLGGEVEADLRPGGEIVVREPDGEERSGFFERIEPQRSLCFWWSEPGSPEPGRVELELLPALDGDGCVLTVTETRPLVQLERELVEIASGGPSAGPTASASLARGGGRAPLPVA